MHFELLLQTQTSSNKQTVCRDASLATNMAKKNVHGCQSEDFFFFFFHHLDARAPHLAVGPAQLDFIHAPKFVDVLSQLVSNFLQVERHDNLSGRRWPLNSWACKRVWDLFQRDNFFLSAECFNENRKRLKKRLKKSGETVCLDLILGKTAVLWLK